MLLLTLQFFETTDFYSSFHVCLCVFGFASDRGETDVSFCVIYYVLVSSSIRYSSFETLIALLTFVFPPYCCL